LRYIPLLLFIYACSFSSPRSPSSIYGRYVGELDETIYSTTLQKKVPYTIVGPLESSDETLPVVYFLHGRGNDRFMFKMHKGVMVLDAYVRYGGEPYVVVTLTGEDSYWVNDTRPGGLKVATAILNDLIPAIEEKHNIGKSKEKRMIAGISMGSHGALQLALNSNHFRCVAAHSLAIRSFVNMHGEFPGLFGKQKEYDERDPLSLIRKFNDKKDLPFSKLWIDIGGEDPFLPRAVLMQEEVSRLGLAQDDGNEFDFGKIFPQGKHDYKYWVRRMPGYIEWYGKCFE